MVKNAPQLLTNATLGADKEPAQAAIADMLFKLMVPASFPTRTPNLLTRDVELGIGKIKNVCSVLKISCSTTMESALQFQLNARLSINQETV